MRSYVIHMSSATARRANVDHLLSVLPNAQVVEAVRGAEATDVPLLPGTLFRPRYPFALSPGEVGCFLSHRACWQAIVAGTEDFGLIVEDDAAIDPAIWPDVIALINRQATVDSYIRLPAKLRETGAVVAEHGVARLIRPRRIGLQTVAQVVGRQAARRLLGASETLDRPVDAFLQMRWATAQPVHAILPSGVQEMTQALGGSTIQKKSPTGARLVREWKRARYRTEIALRSRLTP